MAWAVLLVTTTSRALFNTRCSSVTIDSANDLALLNAVGRFSPLPVVSSRAVKMGGTQALTGDKHFEGEGFTAWLK